MSIAEVTPSKQRVIGKPWQPGQSGNPAGRKPGARGKLSETFLQDLAACWQKNGVAALEKCATETPEVLIKVIASLLPKSIDLNMTFDASVFASKLAQAAALLNVDLDPPRRLRKVLPGQPRVIEHSE
jgi:hypothetical protein